MSHGDIAFYLTVGIPLAVAFVILAWGIYRGGKGDRR